jgi:hypothetical protein
MSVKSVAFVILMKNHLFLASPFAKIVWRMVYLTYNIPPPSNITNMFGNWLNGVHKIDKAKICIGVSVLCWAIWTSRNNIVFNKQKGINFLQVVRRATQWTQSAGRYGYWMQPVAGGCSGLLGWRHINRIANV